MEFHDPKTNTPMVDMDYNDDTLTEKQAKDIQALIKRQTINLQEKTISLFNGTKVSYNCDFGWFRPSRGDQEIVKIETQSRTLVVFKTPEGIIKLGDA